MTTVPAQMTDRWHDRTEPGPDESDLYWHMLMKDHPQVIDLAQEAQQRLARFPGLHMTPLQRLHMTTLLAGPAEEFSQDQLKQMIKIASARLTGTTAVTVTVGGFLYHPEAIMLAVKPRQALASIHDAVQAATRAVTGSHDPGSDPPPWVPHITVCYSTAEQATAPIIAALGAARENARSRSARSASSSSTVPNDSGIGARSVPSTFRHPDTGGPEHPGNGEVCQPSSRDQLGSSHSTRATAPAPRCRIMPYLNQGGACGAAGPASAPGSGLGRPRPARPRRTSRAAARI
jgi:2'-5' RNA ligase